MYERACVWGEEKKKYKSVREIEMYLVSFDAELWKNKSFDIWFRDCSVDISNDQSRSLIKMKYWERNLHIERVDNKHSFVQTALKNAFVYNMELTFGVLIVNNLISWVSQKDPDLVKLFTLQFAIYLFIS